MPLVLWKQAANGEAAQYVNTDTGELLEYYNDPGNEDSGGSQGWRNVYAPGQENPAYVDSYRPGYADRFQESINRYPEILPYVNAARSLDPSGLPEDWMSRDVIDVGGLRFGKTSPEQWSRYGSFYDPTDNVRQIREAGLQNLTKIGNDYYVPENIGSAYYQSLLPYSNKPSKIANFAEGLFQSVPMLAAGGILAPGVAAMYSGLGAAAPFATAATLGGINSGVAGGDVIQGALNGLLSGGVSQALPAVGITDPTIGGALAGGVTSLASGADPLTGALTGAASGSVNSLLRQANNGYTLTANDGVSEPSSMGVSVTPSTGNDALDRILAANSTTWAGADSITGGGPTTPAPQSYLDGLYQPFNPALFTQPKEQKEAGGNVGFFSDILGGDELPYDVDADSNPLTDEQMWAAQNGVLNADGTINWAAFDQADPYGMGSTDGAPVVPGMSFGLGGAGSTIQKLLQALMGGKDSGGLLGRGGILGTGMSGGQAASIAPSLAAINYARNQSPFDTSQLTGLAGQIPTSFSSDTSQVRDLMGQVPTTYSFDTSRLTDTYNQFDPNAVTGQYDLNTAAARAGLANSLQQRGVMGSSFANSDFANFNQARDVGRQTLVNDALTRRAGVANDILGNERAAAQMGFQGLGLRNQMATSLIDNDYRNKALGLQGQGLQRGIFGDILTSQIKQQENKNNLYGRALLALSGGLTPASKSLYGG